MDNNEDVTRSILTQCHLLVLRVPSKLPYFLFIHNVLLNASYVYLHHFSSESLALSSTVTSLFNLQTYFIYVHW